MLDLLLTPLNKIILGVCAVLLVVIGYVAWSNHLENVGAEQARIEAELNAAKHTQEVINQTNTIEREVAKDPTPEETLRKKWESPQ